MHPAVPRVLSLHLRTMATSASAGAKIIDGTSLAKSAFSFFAMLTYLTFTWCRSVRAQVADRIKTLQATHPRFQPQLAIVQAGERPDSTVYVRMKAKAAEEVGIKFKHISLPAGAAVEDVIETVKRLNDDDQISGILVQLPLGEHVNSEGERLVTEAVSPEKDVDGFVNLEKPSTHSADYTTRTGSTRIISDICRLAHPFHSLRRVLLQPSSDF